MSRRQATITTLLLIGAVSARPLMAQMFGGGARAGAAAVPYRDKASWGLCTSGTCSVAADLTVPYIVVAPATIGKCYAQAKTAPTGADLIFDVLRNGTTSIFGGGQFHLTAGASTATTSTFAAPILSEGDTLSVSIAQVGSTTAGGNVSLVCTLMGTTANSPPALQYIAQDTAPALGGDLNLSTHKIGAVTEAEIGYVHGVTGPIQTQLNTKVGGASALTTAGRIPYVTGAGALGQPALLHWDETNARLGIGTTSPSQKLSVAGNIFVQTSGGALTIQNTGGSVALTGSASMIYDVGAGSVHGFNIAGAEKMRLNGNANLLIGTATDSASGAKLQVAGAGIQIAGAAQPACDATHRGMIQYTAAAAGTKDTAAICAKDAANAYAWRAIY